MSTSAMKKQPKNAPKQTKTATKKPVKAVDVDKFFVNPATNAFFDDPRAVLAAEEPSVAPAPVEVWNRSPSPAFSVKPMCEREVELFFRTVDHYPLVLPPGLLKRLDKERSVSPAPVDVPPSPTPSYEAVGVTAHWFKKRGYDESFKEEFFPANKQRK